MMSASVCSTHRSPVSRPQKVPFAGGLGEHGGNALPIPCRWGQSIEQRCSQSSLNCQEEGERCYQLTGHLMPPPVRSQRPGHPP